MKGTYLIYVLLTIFLQIGALCKDFSLFKIGQCVPEKRNSSIVWENLRQRLCSLTTLTEVFPCFSSVVRQMPGLNSQSGGTDRISSEFHLCCACHCVMLLSLCCSVVIMLYCYCVALLLFVLSYVFIVCTVPLPPGVNPIAVDKYIYLYTYLSNPNAAVLTL